MTEAEIKAAAHKVIAYLLTPEGQQALRESNEPMVKPSPFVTIHRSGAVTVDLARWMATPEGRKQLDAVKRLREFVRKTQQSDASAEPK